MSSYWKIYIMKFNPNTISVHKTRQASTTKTTTKNNSNWALHCSISNSVWCVASTAVLTPHSANCTRQRKENQAHQQTLKRRLWADDQSRHKEEERKMTNGSKSKVHINVRAHTSASVFMADGPGWRSKAGAILQLQSQQWLIQAALFI